MNILLLIPFLLALYITNGLAIATTLCRLDVQLRDCPGDHSNHEWAIQNALVTLLWPFIIAMGIAYICWEGLTKFGHLPTKLARR